MAVSLFTDSKVIRKLDFRMIIINNSAVNLAGVPKKKRPKLNIRSDTARKVTTLLRQVT